MSSYEIDHPALIAAVKQLQAVLSSLSSAAEPVKGDAVDDLTAARAARRSAG